MSRAQTAFRGFAQFRTTIDAAEGSAASEHDALLRSARVQLNHSSLGFGSIGRSPIKHFLQRRCQEHGFALLVEVGVWLGLSMAEWLTVPNATSKHGCLHVVGIDPFQMPDPTHHKVKRLPSALRLKLGVPAFNRAFAKYVIRLGVGDHAGAARAALLTGFAPDGLRPLFDRSSSLPVDAVYIDGGKTDNEEMHREYLLRSLAAYSSRYPAAGICGDDWSLKQTPALRPTLIGWARNHSLALGVAKRRTWFMGATERAWGCEPAIQWVVRGAARDSRCGEA